MAERILPAASLAAGFPVIARDGGWLGVPDREIVCLSYVCGCVCSACKARRLGRDRPRVCECDVPAQSGEGKCFRCGHRIAA